MTKDPVVSMATHANYTCLITANGVIFTFTNDTREANWHTFNPDDIEESYGRNTQVSIQKRQLATVIDVAENAQDGCVYFKSKGADTGDEDGIATVYRLPIEIDHTAPVEGRFLKAIKKHVEQISFSAETQLMYYVSPKTKVMVTIVTGKR